MALDRECKDMPYLTGRLIAITEHYAKKHFGPNTISEMFKFPKHGIEAFWRYVDKDDPDIDEIGVMPLERMDNTQQSQAWVAYYHQKAVYNADRDDKKQATRDRIGQRIATLRKLAGMSQEQLSGLAGLQRTHVSRIEAGKYAVTLETIQAIAEALDMTVDIIDPRLVDLAPLKILKQ